MSIGKKIRQRLQELNMKQIRLSKGVGISPSRLSNFISDKREPDLELLARIAKFLYVDLNYFTDICFPTSKKEYEIPQEDHCIPQEKMINTNNDSTVDIPFKKINSKKRVLTHRYISISKIFLDKISDVDKDAICFEVSSGVGGEIFKSGDYLLAVKYKKSAITKGDIIMETGRNGKLYKFLDFSTKGINVWSEEKKDIYHISEQQAEQNFYIIKWIIRNP